MKKKILTILMAVFLSLSIVPFNTKAEGEPDWFTVSNIQTYVPDPVFAQAIYDSVIEQSNKVNWAQCTNVLDVLKTFSGDVTYKKTTKFIKSVEGIQYLENAEIALSNQSFTDISPIGNMPDGVNGKVFSIGSSPIQNWPTDFPDKPGEKYAFSNPQAASADAVYLYEEGAEKIQHIKFDVTVGGNVTKINVENSNYNGTTSTPSKTSPETDDTEAKFNVKDDSVSAVHIQLPVWDYQSGPDSDAVRVSYDYSLFNRFYYTVKVLTDFNTTGGFRIVKYDVDDTNDPKTPLAGATFTVVNDDGEEIAGSPFTTTEQTPIITVSGLPAGTYTITEIGAPVGYSVNSTPKTVEIADVSSSVAVTGGKNSVNVNKDEDTWKPDWNSGLVENGGYYNRMKLVPAGGTTTVTADSKNVSAFITNKSNDSDQEEFEIKAVDVLDYQNSEITYDVRMYGNGASAVVITNATAEDAASAIDSLIANDQVAGNVEITAKGSLVQDEDTYETVVIQDKKFTIWIENTTGDEGKYALNDGGWVRVLGETGTSENKISSDGADNNDNNRKVEMCTEGRADVENGWVVDMDRIAIGPKGDGKSGATYFIKPYLVGDAFEIPLDDDTVIKGYIDYDEEKQTIKICYESGIDGVVLDRDIDVAVAFKRKQDTPPTGDTYNMGIYVFGTVASLAACLYLFKKTTKRV